MEFASPLVKSHYEDLDLHSKVQSRIEDNFSEITLVVPSKGVNRDKYREWQDVDNWVSVQGSLKPDVSIRGLTVGMEIVYVNLETNRVELIIHDGDKHETK